MSKDELIALARKLYGEGMSYGKIADKFNADGVPTASGKGSWERKMIQRLVSADTLKKAEVKVGLKSERESQLEYEIDRLKYSVGELENSIVYYKAENERLERVGMKTERESQLEMEIESLKAEQNQMLDVITMLKNQNETMKEMLSTESSMKDDIISTLESLES